MARGTSTVLFTDIVGSTDLSVAHGDRYNEARRAHDAVLRTAIESNRGTVVKGLGDGVMATFDGVADGVAAARAAQQALHRLNRRRPEPALSIRVGLSVGDVTFEDGDCFGEPVVQAARLCASAEGGQILTTSVVRALAGGARAAGFDELGPLALKGLPDPVDAVEVLWDRPDGTAVALPARLATDLPAFVGRAAELQELHDAFRSVGDHQRRRVVLVAGEPGVGKTTVVSHAIRLWYDAGATVAMGRCEEDLRAPYRPFADAIAHLVAGAPPEVLQAHVARHGASLLPLAPGLARRVEHLPSAASTDPESERFLLFAAVADLLAAMSEAAPLVLLLDDLHWADAGTASLLRSLATAPEPARLLILGTFRSEELAPEHPMGQALAAFRRADAVSRLQLGGLASGDIVELVERWTGASGGTGAVRLADDLVAETDGNAFFVTEVMRHLDETGQLADLSGSARSDASLMPESVREVLGERVARLGSEADGILASAAVIGMEFALPLLAAVTGLADAKLLATLDEASAAALVREASDVPGRFAFTHALVQHAILANIGASREAALHRRVAEVLETDHDGTVPVAELARHWLQATNVSDGLRARDWAVRAGEAALEALAPGDAVAYFRQALLLHDQLRNADVAMRIDLLTQLGTAERQAGDPEHRDTLLKAGRLARRRDDSLRLAAAALANNSGTFAQFQGVDAERVEMLEAAIASGGEGARQALLLGTLANELTYSGDFDRRRQLADDALKAARRHGDPALVLRVLNLVFYALWIPETLDERLALSAESARLLAAVDDPLPRFWAGKSAYLNLTQAGRIEEAAPFLDTIVELAERLAQPALLWRARHTEACRLILAGDPHAAEPLARAALELGERAGEQGAIVYFKTQQMLLHWQRGSMAELAAGIKGPSTRPPNALASLCLIFAEGDRQDEAAALLDVGTDRGFADLTHDPSWITCVAFYAESAIRLGHARSAAVLHRLLLPFEHQVGFDGVATTGSLQHHLGGLAGVLGRHDEAVERLEASVALHRQMGAPFFEARSAEALVLLK